MSTTSSRRSPKKIHKTKQKLNNTQNTGHFLPCTAKGMIFTLDAGISFTIILLSVLLFAVTLNANAIKAEENISNFALEEKANLIADSFVKNFDENNTLRGACVYDPLKRRVKTNELRLANIKNANTIEFGKIFVKELEYTTQTQHEFITLNQKSSSKCITEKRFVLIDWEKGIILIKTCEEG